MTRALIVLNNQADRDKACRWVQGVPLGSRIEFKETKRTLPQNDLLWALLTEVAAFMKAKGRDHTPDQWKIIFMSAYGHEVKFLPTLDQKSFIPLGHSSSDLSVKEATDLIEFILAWGAENGVPFKDQDGTASGEVSPPSSSPSIHHDWLVNIGRMLWAGTFATEDLDENLRLLECQKLSAFAAHPKPSDCPQEIVGKAASAYGYCQRVAEGKIDPQDGLALVAGVVGVDQDDLKGGA